MKTIPETPQPGERYAEYVGGGRWTVQTKTTGNYDPYICLSPLSEADARLLVFGAKMVEVLREYVHQRDSDDADTIVARYERAVAAHANLEAPR